MAAISLRGNVEITNSSFGRNLGVCLAQAKEAQRVHALEGAKHRKDDAKLADWHFVGYDEATAVMEWVAEAKQLMSRCPIVREESSDSNGEKMPLESDVHREKSMIGA